MLNRWFCCDVYGAFAFATDARFGVILLQKNIVFVLFARSTDHQRAICWLFAPFFSLAEWKIALLHKFFLHCSMVEFVPSSSSFFVFKFSSYSTPTHVPVERLQKFLLRQPCMHKHSLIRANKGSVITWKMLGNWMNLSESWCCEMIWAVCISATAFYVVSSKIKLGKSLKYSRRSSFISLFP